MFSVFARYFSYILPNGLFSCYLQAKRAYYFGFFKLVCFGIFFVVEISFSFVIGAFSFLFLYLSFFHFSFIMDLSSSLPLLPLYWVHSFRLFVFISSLLFFFFSSFLFLSRLFFLFCYISFWSFFSSLGGHVIFWIMIAIRR